MTRIFFVRHGLTVWNKESKYQGHSDIELTEEGLRQAELVADRLAEEKFTAIYSSDLCRAFITAETIANRHGLPVLPIPELREINFGKWEGLTYDNINDYWPKQMGKLFTHPDEVEIPGGETFRQLKERAEAAIARLVKKHKDETILVVSHGGTIRTILCAALDIHLNHVWRIRQDNTAVNIIDYYGERVLVTLVNDTHHLNNKKN